MALVKENDDFKYRNINDVLKKVTGRTLDVLIFDPEYEKLSLYIKRKYESICEDDEMNKQASIMTRTELYTDTKMEQLQCSKIKNLKNSRSEPIFFGNFSKKFFVVIRLE